MSSRCRRQRGGFAAGAAEFVVARSKCVHELVVTGSPPAFAARRRSGGGRWRPTSGGQKARRCRVRKAPRESAPTQDSLKQALRISSLRCLLIVPCHSGILSRRQFCVAATISAQGGSGKSGCPVANSRKRPKRSNRAMVSWCFARDSGVGASSQCSSSHWVSELTQRLQSGTTAVSSRWK